LAVQQEQKLELLQDDSTAELELLSKTRARKPNRVLYESNRVL